MKDKQIALYIQGSHECTVSPSLKCLSQRIKEHATFILFEAVIIAHGRCKTTTKLHSLSAECGEHLHCFFPSPPLSGKGEELPGFYSNWLVVNPDRNFTKVRVSTLEKVKMSKLDC